MRKSRLDDLENMYEEDKNRPNNQEFGAWFDSFVSEYADLTKKERKYGPWFTYSYTQGTNIIQLFDHTYNEPIAIFLNPESKTITCSKHNVSECIHKGFCYGHPKTFRILVDSDIISDKKGWPPTGTPDPDGRYVHAGYNSDLTEQKESGDMRVSWEEKINELNSKRIDQAKTKAANSVVR